MLELRRLLPCCVVALATVAPTLASAADPAQPGQEALKRLSIEELMNLDVTLATRRPEPIATTPAAVSVITSEDIRRSGVTTIADAISLADGIHVARSTTASWSIATRGFNSTSANKMLVMIDGRTVYSPLFSGVFWNSQDYALEDIERIEVIRGPGATLWGANAVNGVINIITRHTRDTRGGYLQAGSGNEDPAVVEARYGGAAGEATYRVFGKHVVRASQKFTDGTSAVDRRERTQMGFRFDSGGVDTAAWMLKGDALSSTNQFIDRPDGEFTFLDLHGRWSKALTETSQLQVQSYVNHEYRRIPLQLTHRLTTFDLDAQHAFTTTRHDVVWGGGYRVNRDRTEGTPAIAFDPPTRTYPLVNAYFQDEVAIAPDRVYVTAGMKLERNVFSGVEVQPSMRARVLLPRQQLVWGAVSRAVRRPTRLEDDLVIRTAAGVLVTHGNDDFQPESLVATEVGYRVQPANIFSADATVFFHNYDRLRSQEAPPDSPSPIMLGNTLNGSSRGVELALGFQPIDRWNVHASYTRLEVKISRDPDSRDVGGGASEANDPDHMLALRTSVDLPANLEFDARIRSIGALPNPRVPAYSELSLRLGWRPMPRLDLSLIGDDLLHDRHPEFNPTARGFEEFERSIRVRVTIRF